MLEIFNTQLILYTKKNSKTHQETRLKFIIFHRTEF